MNDNDSLWMQDMSGIFMLVYSIGALLNTESNVREGGKCFIFMLQTDPEFSSVFQDGVIGSQAELESRAVSKHIILL